MKPTWPLWLAGAIVFALWAVPANATTMNRVWVSGTGNDVAGCGAIASPCATFTGALTSVAAGGEIDCLSPGDFGNVVISKPVSIVCDGVSNGGIINNTGNDAVTINVPSGAVVYLSGLDINGLSGAGAYGVNVETGATVYIVHSTIRGFSQAGVWLESTTSLTRVIIKDSIIVNNGAGVLVEAQSAATNVALIFDSVVDGNSNFAAGADALGGPSVIAVENTALTGSPTGLDLTNGATGELVGPSNAIAGAIIGTTTSVPFK